MAIGEVKKLKKLLMVANIKFDWGIKIWKIDVVFVMILFRRDESYVPGVNEYL